MRKFAVLLIAALVMSLGVAFADEGHDEETAYWAGVSLGYPGAAVHFGINDVIGEGIDARVNLGYLYGGQISPGFGVGVDVLLALTEVEGINVYGGGGVVVQVASEFGVGVELLVGGEYDLKEVVGAPVSAFAEVGPVVNLVPDFAVDFGLRVGANYGF